MNSNAAAVFACPIIPSLPESAAHQKDFIGLHKPLKIN